MKSFKKHYPGDITENDIKMHLTPHLEKFKVYVKEFVIPEMCAFWIASGYYDSNLFEDPYDIILNDVLCMFNDDYQVDDDLRMNVQKLLELKYGLIIDDKNPLKFR